MEPPRAAVWTSSDKRKRRPPRRQLPAAKFTSVAIAIALLYAQLCDALVQQVQVVARCREWVNDTCAFAALEPVTFASLDLKLQTLCRVRFVFLSS